MIVEAKIEDIPFLTLSYYIKKICLQFVIIYSNMTNYL